VIDSSKRPLAVDRLLLARASEELSDLDSATAQYEAVLKSQDVPLFQKQFIRFLIRHDQFDRAEKLLAQLEQAEPEKAEDVLNLRIESRRKAGRKADIETVVDEYLKRHPPESLNDLASASFLKTSAEMFTNLELFDAAEKRHRELLQKFPGTYRNFAVWLAERGRVQDAIDLVMAQVDKDQLRAAAAMVPILRIAERLSNPSSFDPTAPEAVIKRTLETPNAPQTFLLEVAILRLTQGRFAESVKLYERMMERTPENALLRNNLALVLSELPDRKQEALPMIEQALLAMPDSNDVRDTKGIVLLALGKPAEAREIFEQASAANPRNPNFHLHLSQTLNLLGDTAGALEHARLAIENKVDFQLLTPAERQYIREMKTRLSALPPASE
ncbi:MAG: tetratricopeptide repeat protein, partial [Planctomycetes bacterium]|nr:tetratricopeptide repeat protein [Planctomycetota bacterium]